MPKSEIILRIKELMEHFNFGSGQFADKIGMDKSNFSKLFTTDKPIGDGILTKIAYGLNVNKNWLLTGEGDMFKPELPVANSLQRGVPYYDIDVSASFIESFSDIKEEPDFYVDFKPFNDCTVYLTVYGDSMYPLFASGEIAALKKVDNPNYIQYGEPYLVITNAEANNMRTLKLIRKSQDKRMIILKPANPNFDELEIPRDTILSLYIAKGKITRKQL
jgi:SOS-response transcriptional repressor LexA